MPTDDVLWSLPAAKRKAGARVAAGASLVLALLMAAPTAASALPPATPTPSFDDTVLGNLTPAGAAGDGESAMPSISRDGRYLLFYSASTDLTGATGDQVYRRDLLTNSTVLVSQSTEAVAGDAGSYPVGISADGRFAAFSSEAANLVPDDTNGKVDTFVRDLVAGTTTRVSVSSAGEQADGDSHELDLWGYPGSISGDGRFVVFSSNATNLAPGGSTVGSNVFIRDTRLGTTTVVSDLPESTDSFNGAVSDDGRYVAYAGWVNGYTTPMSSTHTGYSVFRRDLQTGVTEMVGVPYTGTTAGYYVFDPSISADGNLVGFTSDATNLVPGDIHAATVPNTVLDFYVRDMAAGSTVRGAVADGGAQIPEGANVGTVSADGSTVAFLSPSDAVVADDTNGVPDAFVRALDSDSVVRVSLSSTGAQAPTGTGRYTDSDLSLSGDGSVVGFESDSPLVPGAPDAVWNAYARLTAVAPTITSAAPPAPVLGQVYHFTVTATGTGPITLALTGSLPDGLSFDPAAGILSGTPTTPGTFSVTLTATNAAGAAAPQKYSLVVAAAPPTPAPTPSASPTTASGPTALAATGAETLPLASVGLLLLATGAATATAAAFTIRRRRA